MLRFYRLFPSVEKPIFFVRMSINRRRRIIPSEILMSSNVQLRNTIETDLPIFFEQQLDPDAIRMAAFPSRNREAFMAHWSTVLVDDSVLVKTVLFNGDIAGNIVCFEQLGEREVGYWLGKEYWGKGIASQALAQFLDLIKTRPLYAHVAKHNVASKRVLEKCGFKIAAEDKFFSKIFGEDIEEYILILNASGSADPSE
jgi:RimJ/RimL family protein N-acetyltransferase